jgi:drug/metabolite transporter (DMT)-like permease
MPFRILFLLFINIIFTVSGHLLLKKGMLLLGPLEFSLKNLGTLFVNGIKNGYLWVGLFCYFGAFILWLFILSQVKLSAAYPIGALVYVLIIFASWLLFKESIGPYQLIGSFLIITGVLFLARGL